MMPQNMQACSTLEFCRSSRAYRYTAPATKRYGFNPLSHRNSRYNPGVGVINIRNVPGPIVLYVFDMFSWLLDSSCKHHVDMSS